MTNKDWKKWEAALNEASNLAPHLRIDFLDSVLKSDNKADDRIEDLLALKLEQFLEEPLSQILGDYLDHTCDSSKHPRRIGPYRIIDLLGAGGMGRVYLAYQHKPVKRKLAVKILKQGLDSKSAVARFHMEYQALARLNHGSIAHIYDVGTDEEQRPFFSMEYFPGKSLVKFCDTEGLGLHERIKILIQVCEGMEHAHQKGIIHRDLKPSNILGARLNGKIVVKVIDFGIAKTISGLPLGDSSLNTERGTILGTLAYMSPEQTEGPLADVDTRTDIYGLGAVLYELLTSNPPHDRSQLDALSYDRQLEIVRTEEPLPPSIRVNKENQTPPPWRHQLKGELDWILGKALARDRERRYGNAKALAMDLDAYLNNKPVTAGPVSPWYRFTKFVKRHRTLVAVTTVVLISLTVAVLAILNGLIVANDARAKLELAANESREQAQKSETLYGFLTGMIKAPSPYQRGRDVKISEMLFAIEREIQLQFSSHPELQIPLYRTLGATFDSLGLTDKARNSLTKALNLAQSIGDTENAKELHLDLANFHIRKENLEEGERALGSFFQILKEQKNPSRNLRFNGARISALLLQKQGQLEASVKAYHDLLDKNASEDIDQIAIMTAQRGLAIVFQDMDRHQEALFIYKQLLDKQKTRFGSDHPEVLHTLNNLANVHVELGEYTEALEAHKFTRGIRTRELGQQHPLTMNSIHNIGWTLMKAGRYEEAEKELAWVVNRFRQRNQSGTLRMLKAQSNLGLVQMKLGKYEKAVAIFREARKTRIQQNGKNDGYALIYSENLGRALSGAKAFDEATEILEDTLRRRNLKFGSNSWQAISTRFYLGRHALNQEQYETAAHHFRFAWKETSRSSPYELNLAMLSRGYLGFSLCKSGKLQEGSRHLWACYQEVNSEHCEEIYGLIIRSGIKKYFFSQNK